MRISREEGGETRGVVNWTSFEGETDEIGGSSGETEEVIGPQLDTTP